MRYMIIEDLRTKVYYLDFCDTMIRPFEKIWLEGNNKKDLLLKYPQAIDLTLIPKLKENVKK